MHYVWNLPDINVLNEYIASYFRSPVCLAFLILDPTYSWDTIRLAYQTSLDPPGATSAKASIYAFLSSSGIWNLRVAHPVSIDVPTLVSQVEHCIPEILREQTIDGLQAILMLVRTSH